MIHDPDTQLAFALHENKGVFALLLGSGLSRAAAIPTGWEITLDLIRRVGLAQGAGEQADWAEWYRAKTGTEPSYSRLLEELTLVPAERRSILHSYIEPSDDDREAGRKSPTKAHFAIADLVRAGYVRVIVTTNFDRLMENALRDRGVEPTVVASPDALAGAEPPVHSACYLLKLHGDYKDARILNTDAELETYPTAYNQLLDRIMDEYGLIVAGWSGEWDHALRAVFERAPNRRYPVYWAARGDLGAKAQELTAHRRARVVPIDDADAFFHGLWERTQTLAASRKQNPLSVELLVASVKRYLAKPEHRIQLAELFDDEVRRLFEKLNTPELNPRGSWRPDEFRARVALYEAATEPLAKMIGALGRWGDGSDLPIVLDVLKAIIAHAVREGGGLNVWLHLRTYPAVLAFTAYGLGLTRAERWKVLHVFLSAHLAREDREPKRVVETVFLWAWKGWDNDVWRHSEGLDRHKTALSDHLCRLFAEWGDSFLGLTSGDELLFERFEVLASLGHLNATDESELEPAATMPGSSGKIWMPVGRAGWDSQNWSILVSELAAPEFRSAIVRAGLAPSERYIDLFRMNFEKIASQMRW